MMRPQPALWFEILAPREDALGIAEAIASAGLAEFESPADGGENGMHAECGPLIQRFRDLEREFGHLWQALVSEPLRAFPNEMLPTALEHIEAWAREARPVLASIEHAASEHALLDTWLTLLETSALDEAERRALAGGIVAAAIHRCPQPEAVRVPADVLLKPVPGSSPPLILAIGPAAPLAELGERIRSLGGQALAVPDGIAAGDATTALAARRSTCAAAVGAGRQRLDALAAEHGLAEAVVSAHRVCWCVDNARAVEARRALCRLTGWTCEPATLQRRLAEVAVPTLLRFAPPPRDMQVPLILRNPWWARPYEAFCGLLGMPAHDAADPSALVALVFPLLFGYMFGDLGQGLLIAALGLLLGRRWTLANLLVPAGLSAAFFGWVFGSVFSLHGVVTALWVEPLHDPMPVLLLPLGLGAALLCAGLVLAGFEARWRGEMGAGLNDDGPALVLYLGGLACLLPGVAPAAALLAAVALALLLAVRRAGNGSEVLRRIGGSLERAFQLAINTISFVRVGAFAIAHAGLSSAMLLLAAAAGDGATGVVVIVVGNLLIVGLELLVVSIQTTRLVLFEFFTRFFLASGRAFRPALPPTHAFRENHHET